MTTKKCNWKTDLQLTETFYTLAENNTLIATPIPDDAIDFQIVYRAEHDCRYTVSRTRGVYMGCKKIDANTLAISGEIVAEGEKADGIVNQAKAGADWQLSIGADVEEMRRRASGIGRNVVIEITEEEDLDLEILNMKRRSTVPSMI